MMAEDRTRTTVHDYLRQSLRAPEGCNETLHAALSGAQRLLDGGTAIVLDHEMIERRVGGTWKTMASNKLLAASAQLHAAAEQLAAAARRL